jgi:hypothetical protein
VTVLDSDQKFTLKDLPKIMLGGKTKCYRNDFCGILLARAHCISHTKSDDDGVGENGLTAF